LYRNVSVVSSLMIFKSPGGVIMMRKEQMRGLTLLELLLVIAIMAVIVGFVPLSADMIRRERVASAARVLYADIQKARLDAMTQGGMGFGIRLESPNSYVIFKFIDCNGDSTYDVNACSANGREETAVIRRILHPSLELHKTNPSTHVNNDVRIFDRFGTPRQANWGLGMITILIDNVAESEFVKCVSVSTHRMRESMWNGSGCI
jgi:prepilin-type N-terminal cleavage/methylation domain-containing protein